MRIRTRRQNEPEAQFEETATSKGYEVSKRGWPDFLCFKDGRFAAVEVKPRTAKGRLCSLKSFQVVTLALLQKKGIDCYVSDGQTTEPFVLDQHLPRVVKRVSHKTTTFVLSVLLSGELGGSLTEGEQRKIENLLWQKQC